MRTLFKCMHVYKRKCSTIRSTTDRVLALIEILGKEKVLNQDISRYNVDWTKSFNGGTVICLPSNSTEVSKILTYCNENKIGVVPQGGNTGLVGGGVGLKDEVILSLSKMNSIISLDENSGILECEAGCILEDLSEFVMNKTFVIPLDLGAKGSCMIGGNVSTNAGGLRVVRYGSLHANILGLEVVLPNGDILDMMKIIQKDNTGYPLKNIFIGSEGTLGIITKVSIKLAPKPESVQITALKTSSFLAATTLLQRTRSKLNDILSAFEFLDEHCLQQVSQHFPQLVQGDIFKESSPARAVTDGGGIEGPIYVIIETAGPEAGHQDRLLEFLGEQLEGGVVEDGIVAQSAQQSKMVWSIRESITTRLSSTSRECRGVLIKYDVSIPISRMSDAVRDIRKNIRNKGYTIQTDSDRNELDSSLSSIQPVLDQSYVKGSAQKIIEMYNFGHMGDQNLHLNLLHRDTASFSAEVKAKLKEDLDDCVYSVVRECRGSISAEHGIGQLKREALAMSKSKLELGLMRQIKQVFDPNGIMNPSKIFLD